MGELKEKPVVQSAKPSLVAGRVAKVVRGAAKTRKFRTLTPEQEALYGSISLDAKNTMDAAAVRAAKHANRE